MYNTSLASITDEIEALLAQKLSAKGRNLKEKTESVGRRLPRTIRGHVDYLIRAEGRYRNPKFAHQYDPDRVLEAYKQCVSQLEKIDPRAQKSARRLAWLTGILVNLMIAAAALSALAIYVRG